MARWDSKGLRHAYIRLSIRPKKRRGTYYGPFRLAYTAIADATHRTRIAAAATQVFSTYELAETILEKLTIVELAHAQRIWKATRGVAAKSQRVRDGLSVYGGGGGLVQPQRPFKRFVDFDSTDHSETDNGPYFCAEELFPVSTSSNYRRVLGLPYTLQSASRPVVIHRTYGTVWQPLTPAKFPKTRTIITPERPDTVSSASGTPVEGSSDIWRCAVWAPNYDVVVVKLRSRCPDGEWMKWEKRFPGNITVGETYDWMFEVASREHEVLTGVRKQDALVLYSGR